MEKRYVITRSSDSISHAGTGKERKNHKYISREWKNGRWRYEYEEAKKDVENANAQYQNALIAKKNSEMEYAQYDKEFHSELQKHFDSWDMIYAEFTPNDKNGDVNVYSKVDAERKQIENDYKNGNLTEAQYRNKLSLNDKKRKWAEEEAANFYETLEKHSNAYTKKYRANKNIAKWTRMAEKKKQELEAAEAKLKDIESGRVWLIKNGVSKNHSR